MHFLKSCLPYLLYVRICEDESESEKQMCGFRGLSNKEVESTTEREREVKITRSFTATVATTEYFSIVLDFLNNFHQQMELFKEYEL